MVLFGQVELLLGPKTADDLKPKGKVCVCVYMLMCACVHASNLHTLHNLLPQKKAPTSNDTKKQTNSQLKVSPSTPPEEEKGAVQLVGEACNFHKPGTRFVT